MTKAKRLLPQAKPPSVNIDNNVNGDSRLCASPSPLPSGLRTPPLTAAHRRHHHRASTLELLLNEQLAGSTALAGSVPVDNTMRRWLRTRASIGAEGDSVQEFVSATTLHGISQVWHSRSMCGRVFWMVVIALMILLVVGQVGRLVVHYIDNPTVTSVRVVHPKNGLRFPAFTLCMMSKFNQTALTEKYPQINHTLAEFATSSFISSSSTALLDISYFAKFVKPNSTYLQLLEELDANLQDTINGRLLDFIKDTTFTCEAQFQYCWLANGAMFDCCSGVGFATKQSIVDTTRYLIHSGVCYEFRPKYFRPSMPGPVGGFGFVYVYPRQHLLDSAFNTYGGYAMQMYTSPADAMLERSPTLLPIGYYSHVSLTATKNKRVELNYLGKDTCRDPVLRYFDNYSYSNCQAECMVDSTLDACNCTGVTTVGNIPENQTCSPLEALRCYFRETRSGEQGQRLTQCRNEKCKEQCEYWSYRPNLAVSRAFNPFLEKRQKDYWRLPQTVNGTSTTESVVIAEIYFKDIIYTVIEEKAALTLESFVSNIGGAFGLWTGGSVISWIHLIYFCVLKGMRSRRRRRREDRRQMNRLGRRLGSNFDEPLTSAEDLPTSNNDVALPSPALLNGRAANNACERLC